MYYPTLSYIGGHIKCCIESDTLAVKHVNTTYVAVTDEYRILGSNAKHYQSNYQGKTYSFTYPTHIFSL